MPDRDTLIEQYKKLLAENNIEAKLLAFEILVEIQDEDMLKEFLNMYQDELFEKKTIDLIDTHINFYLLQDNLNKAKEVLEEYKNKPFVSMEVEDYMKEIDERIKKIENLKSVKPASEESIYEDFTSANQDRIAKAFYALSKLNIRQSTDLVSNILLKDIPYQYKALILFILIDQEVNANFKVTRADGTSFIFNGASSKFPLDKESFIAVDKYYDSLNESPSTINLAKEMIKVSETMHYPDSMFDLDYDPLIIAEAILFLVKNQLGEVLNPNELSLKTGLSQEECDELFDKLQKKMA